ncbi:MAG: hypothetical protein WB760_32670 [Xanthobacteraceae bacterium]
MADDKNQPEQPRVEPEIIPPDRSGHQSPWSPYGFTETRGTHRIYVTRMGPFGIALLLLAIAAVATIVMIAFLGAVLIWIPIVAIVVIAGALLRLLRR